jgi:hypothetical protein
VNQGVNHHDKPVQRFRTSDTRSTNPDVETWRWLPDSAGNTPCRWDTRHCED